MRRLYQSLFLQCHNYQDRWGEPPGLAGKGFYQGIDRGGGEIRNMGDGTKDNPYTREDVLKLIKEHGGIAEGLNLSGKTFETGIDLRGPDLTGVIFKAAYLWDAHFERVNLTESHLEKAFLSRAHLEEANLIDAHLEGADLMDAHLKGANLSRAHLEKAYLWDAHLEGANLWRAHLEGADLVNAEFSPETRLEETDWGNFILGEEKTDSFSLAADTYQRLKQWYTAAGMSDIADKFSFREMEAKRKAQN
ncbi:MAG: pentapeptide repeat-containing protein [Chloroflexi bacterium]|nr:pentapeptide repeat-containing protein [Chloroflexota bacterium]